MLSTAARARLTVVLVGARNPSNIGAAARALQDFGFSDLRIVNDFAAPFAAAQLEATQLEAAHRNAAQHSASSPQPKSAVAAQHVMQAARRYDTLAAAIADCTLIVATTAIGERQLKQPILPLQQAAPLILAALNSSPAASTPEPAAPSRVALLFGSEKTGLTNDQLSHANLLTTIPMFSPRAADPSQPARHLSMNLGQSVAVCLYELTRFGFEASVEIPPLHEAPATAEDRERLTQLLLDVLHTTGYTRRFPANSSEPLVRQLVQQLIAPQPNTPTGITHRQAETLMGILRQILWHEHQKPKP